MIAAGVRATLCALLIMSIVPLSAAGATPSFLCSKAKTWVEKSVCASDHLSALDLELAVVYARLLKVVSGEKEKTLSSEQRKWWSSRNACQKAVDPPDCLEASYLARIVELKQRPDYPGDERETPAPQFTDDPIKTAGKGWSRNLSAYLKAIQACQNKASKPPRAVLTVWSDEQGELISMRLRGRDNEDLVCVAYRSGAQATLRGREEIETLPDAGPVLYFGDTAPSDACTTPAQVLDVDEQLVGWLC